MSLTALPQDCLLACLSRVPYADLRNGLPSTCKSLRDAVTSAAFRKTREAAGYVEWAAFARDYTPPNSNSYLIQASAAYRTVMGPPEVQAGPGMVRISSGRGDEVVIIQDYPEFRADAYHPLQNRWRELAPLYRHQSNWFRDGEIGGWATCGSLGSTYMVIGGDVETNMPMDLYNASEDTWSRLPDLPFEGAAEASAQTREVDGKLWLYSWDGRLQETFVYDPATETWTAGPRLPHELYDEGGVHWHCMAFEVRKRFCLMGLFQLAPEEVQYLAFIWDPIRGAWDEAPFPVPPYIALHGECIDNHIIVSGNIKPSNYTYEGFPRTPHLFVLRPDSRDWEEWSIPDALRDGGLYITAIRFG